MGLKPGELLIDDSTPHDELFRPIVNGELKSRGAIPRDFAVDPPTMFAPPSEIVLIPRSEWSERIKDQEAAKSRTSDVLLLRGIPSLDQDGVGYCWGHSTVGCQQGVRALNNQPTIRLNAFSVCAVIKNGRDEGGWCGLSAKFLRETGCASMEVWPEKSRNLSNYNEACKANMALHKITEDWVDLTRDVYDQNLTFDMLATCLLSNVPCATDFNWWSHSVMSCDLVEVEPGDFGIRIRNSWTDSYGDKGFAVLRGSKCKPDGALAIRAVTISPK